MMGKGFNSRMKSNSRLINRGEIHTPPDLRASDPNLFIKKLLSSNPDGRPNRRMRRALRLKPQEN
jgi:hypothetical protein